MSDTPDPMEAELAALQPAAVSPELRRRVAQRLAGASLTSRQRFVRLAVTGGLAAACLVVLIAHWADRRRIESNPKANHPRPTVAVEDTEPTRLAYEQALARSSEDLDALLQKEAMVPRPHFEESLPIGILSRSDAALQRLLGDD
jgi:hypothetical protein